MSIQLHLSPTNTTDISIYQCGHHACDPSHSFGPAVRDHFLIHYVVAGKGTFYVGDKTYTVEKGQGFLICPDSITYYEADATTPWTYYWIGFHGLKASEYLETANLTLTSPLFTATRPDYITQCFQQMIETQDLKYGRDLQLIGLMYTFLAELVETAVHTATKHIAKAHAQQYVQQAVLYIERNYSREISVETLANYIGLDRSYLCRLFKQFLSQSPQAFLIHFRIHKAIELMHHSNLSIGDIARSVGYNDPLTFSRIFSKVKGMSPSSYQKQLIP